MFTRKPYSRRYVQMPGGTEHVVGRLYTGGPKIERTDGGPQGWWLPDMPKPEAFSLDQYARIHDEVDPVECILAYRKAAGCRNTYNDSIELSGRLFSPGAVALVLMSEERTFGVYRSESTAPGMQHALAALALYAGQTLNQFDVRIASLATITALPSESLAT